MTLAYFFKGLETCMIVWTDYFKYRAGLRGFDLTEVEKILSFGDERYFDTATGRNVVVGKHGRLLDTRG